MSRPTGHSYTKFYTAYPPARVRRPARTNESFDDSPDKTSEFLHFCKCRCKRSKIQGHQAKADLVRTRAGRYGTSEVLATLRRWPRYSQNEMPSLKHVLAMPRKASRHARPVSLRVPPEILRLVTWDRMSFSDPLVWRGISGRSSTTSSWARLA